MISVYKQMRRVGLAVVALGSIGMSGTAYAQIGTPSNTLITNTATVNYTVGTVAQTPISAVAEFRVDTVIDSTVDESAPVGASTVAPGQQNAFTSFLVTNSGNTDEGFTFQVTDVGGTFTIGTLTAYVDADADGIYDAGPGGDTATTIATLASGGTATVFIVANIPAGATNGQLRDVRLQATAVQPTSLAAWVPSGGPDTAMGVEIVVDDVSDTADDQFAVVSAALAVSKSSEVREDPVNNTTDPKAIPGAFVEYSITLSNTLGSSPATLVSISDPIPADTTFAPDRYPGSMDVRVTVGGVPTYCEAEAGSDTNLDGCFLTGGALSVGSPALTNVANGAGNDVVVSFQVTID
jgi:uncharacterized repeat protein (TIGR01451 family)